MLINLRQNNFNIEVDLPLSKSESNRALMIAFYLKTQRYKDSETQRLRASESLRIGNSDDTVLLQSLLDKIEKLFSTIYRDSSIIELDCANAGTVFRFLTTAVASLQLTIYKEQLIVDAQRLGDSVTRRLEFFLTGSERMKQRPIKSLVDALRSLGASIEYTEKEGYPPILIRPCNIEGGRVEVNVEQSSQFASSLLLAAPLWKNGMELHLKGNLSSLPYIDMTINMMRRCGIDVERKERVIIVRPGNYKLDNINIEPDWSAAAFWYEIVALSENANVFLKNLNINSLQADAVAMQMFETLGVETISTQEGIVVRKSQRCNDTEMQSEKVTFNFKDSPDLFPSVIATCAGLKIDATFTGLKNLSIKESDRKKAMMNELKKINISFKEISDDELKMICLEKLPYFTKDNPIFFNTYADHRIAMALAMLSPKIGNIMIDDKDVVKKSYPKFWEDYENIY